VNWAESSPRDLFRACAKPGNSAAWSEFISRYHPIIRSAAAAVARRWGHGAVEERDDLIQEIYLKVCASGARVLLAACDVEPEAVPSYLRVIAVNAGHDYFRTRATERRGGGITEQISERHEAVSAADPNMERRLAIQEIDAALDSQTQVENGVRDRAVFRLHYHQGMTAREIADVPGIQLSIKGVEAVLHRLTGRIHEQLAGAQGSPRGSRLNQVGGG
jgi:RNA polymerase sigma factor (sigma-70 family)